LEWIRKKPTLSFQLRAYGSHAWVTTTDSAGKAKPRAKEGILIGYDEQRRAYRVFCPSERKILVSDAVIFDEQRIGLRTPRSQVNNLSLDDLFDFNSSTVPTTASVMGTGSTVSAGPPAPATNPRPISVVHESPVSSGSTSITTVPDTQGVVPVSESNTMDHDQKHAVDQATTDAKIEDVPTGDNVSTNDDSKSVSTIYLDDSDDCDNDDDDEHEEATSDKTTATATASNVRRSGRSIKPTPAILESIAYKNDKSYLSAYAYLTESVSISEKKAWAQEEWKAAMQIELDSLRDLGTYKVVPRPVGQSVVGGRWVLAKKKAADGTTKYKARYVGKGYSQIHGVDFNETWSPTLRGQSIRLLVSLAATDGSSLKHLDVKNAFINAPLEEEIYVEIPFGAPGYGTSSVWRLLKALYGLKQAGRAWNLKFTKTLRGLNFKQSVAEPCLFVGTEEFSGIVMGVYVDDCIVKYKNALQLKKLIAKLQEELPIKDEGVLKSFVGIEVEYNDDCIKLHQSTYLLSVLQRFNYDKSNPVSTPCLSTVPTESQKTKSRLEEFDMRAIVGALLYLSIHTRPDIAYAVAKLAQNVATPTSTDYQAAARILRYLNGTRTMGIRFPKTMGKPTLNCFVDSSWGNYSDGKSHGGHVIFLGGPIDWSTKKQNMVCLSSSEAELIAAVDAGKTTLWYRSLLGELGHKQAKPTVIFEDNTGAIVLAHTSVIGKRTRHMNIRYHCMNDWVSSGELLLQKVTTAKNTADIMTKALDKTLFQRFASKLVF
jgi:hypothetical protein